MDNNFRKVEAMLYNYKLVKAEIKNIELEIIELETEYKGCGAISYEEKTGPTHKFNSSVENEMIAKRFQPEQLERRKRKLNIQIEKTDNALEILSNEERQVIELRYMKENKKVGWNTIAEMMELSDVTCRTLKNNAINKIIPIIFIREINEKLS